MTTTEQRDASRHDGRDSHGRRHHLSRSRRDDPSPRRRRDDRRHESDRSHHKSRDEESARVADRDSKRNTDASAGKGPLNDESKSLSHVKDDPPAKRDRSPRGTKRFSESRDSWASRRPQTFFQHDERGSAGQSGRRNDHHNSDYGRKRDEKEHLVDKDKEKTNGDNLQVKVEQDQLQKDGDSTWKHDGFFQLEEEAPLAKRRPPFQEMKLSLEQHKSAPSVTELDSRSGKSDQPGTTAEMVREERTHGRFGNRRPFVRPDDQSFRRGFPDHRSDGHRHGYDSRGRFPGRGTMNSDRFQNPNDWRGNEYQAGSDQGEKWKHDLYDQANRSPTPKTEEEQIAKVEALLAL